ncbi:MAG: His/Gly/Thr/Pro-type tRNA ligase C-terminal domain-containing protein, partial [Flavobacteriales bacterium]
MQAKAKSILQDLKLDYNCQYDEKDAIGKRYRRQDAIGTPICITIDPQTLEDNTITVRFRDDMSQKRIQLSALDSILDENLSMKSLLKSLV